MVKSFSPVERPQFLRLHWGLALLLVLAACSPGRQTEQSLQPATPRAYLNQAQPRLPTIKLWLGTEELITETARSNQEIATGMMYRTEMEENEAMIFVFSRERQASFYMRNTRIPLSIAYLGSDGTILEIHDMTPLEETPVVASQNRVRYALEVRQGWFDRHGVREGMVVSSANGSLNQVFFGR